MIKSSIDGLSAETQDQREWSLYGWVFHPEYEIESGYITYKKAKVATVSCAWPRPDVLQSLPEVKTPNTGFKSHIILPPEVPSGILNLEIIWEDKSGSIIGTDTFEIDVKEASMAPRQAPPKRDAENLYLNLMTKALTGALYLKTEQEISRDDGRDWPEMAHTMIGTQRLEHLRACLETVIHDNIPGDFIETGVWRGGACIMARAVFKSLGDESRKVWVADSFRGLPQPDTSLYPADEEDEHYTFEELAISRKQVAANFLRYDLLDEQVRFLEGWFKDTLPKEPEGPLSVIRLDGDMYESTIDALKNLYPRLSPGGYCIIDDYGCIEACRMAVRDYRKEKNITSPIEMIDWTGAWWRKPL